MIMKTILLFCLTLSTLTCYDVFGQTSIAPHQWIVKLKVVDDENQPVSGADAWVAYYLPSSTDQSSDVNNPASDKIGGLTDENGVFTASHEDTGSISLGLHVRKEGYYPTDVIHEFAKFRDSDTDKWSPNITLVLKKIVKPIPMYAKRILGAPSVLNQPMGYDLIAGDWVAPYGKGANTDIIFTIQKTAKDTEFVVTFPNSDDGIQEFPVSYKITEGSALRSPHEAPKNGYQSKLIRTSANSDENKCYFIRVKSASAEGALYGKMYGDPMNFCYLLNPEPNSRNVEFDPKKNLIKNFRLFAERVYTP